MMDAALERFAPRQGRESDEVLGARPDLVFAPTSIEQAAMLMGETARAGLRLAFVGGGTDLALGGTLDRFDAVVRTERLSTILEHAPSDQIVVAQAGVTLATLQTTLAPSGQRLAIDPPRPERATLGGIVAANAFGPLRARYGSIRDLIIGVSFVRADGVAARGGGKVVKNVAGFDLPRLMVGSLGTLGLITTVTFRLHPLPEATVTLLLPSRTPSQIRALARAIRGAQLEPTAVVALTGREGLDVILRFEGFEAGVRQQRDRLIALVSPTGTADALDAAAAERLFARHDQLRTAGTLRAKFAALPGAIETVAGEALPPLLEALDDPGLVLYPTLGLGFLSGVPRVPERVAQGVSSARTVFGRLGGSLVLLAAPLEIRASSGVFGDPPPALSLMQSVKSSLDPERRLSPGRFVGGI